VAAFAQYFDFDKSVVKRKYLPNIKQAADILKVNPQMSVVIAGHTDSVGTKKYNIGLGRRRAQAVRKLFIRYGISAKRLKIKSYGESRPIASNKTSAGRARNRRVEIEGWRLKSYY
jgi:OOP family OmpA-OmpF porin